MPGKKPEPRPEPGPGPAHPPPPKPADVPPHILKELLEMREKIGKLEGMMQVLLELQKKA